MAWKNKSSRTAPLPADWPKRRAIVLKRDGYRCVHIREDTGRRCIERATDVDHLGEPDDHRLSMLQSLCSYHHGQKTSSQGGRRVRQKKKITLHPGLIPD